MSDVLRAALDEITARPLAFAAEIGHFVLLVVIVWFVLRGAVGKTLLERRRRIAAEVEQANDAARQHAEAETRAAALLEEARAQAQRVAEEAAASAQDARREGLLRIERDAAAAVLVAEKAVDADKSRVAREASEQLIDLVGVVVRRFLEEALTESERRSLTQKLILDRLKELAG